MVVYLQYGAVYWVGQPFKPGSYRQKFKIETENTSALFFDRGILAGRFTLGQNFNQEFKNGTKWGTETLRIISNVSFNEENNATIAFTNLCYGNISRVLYDPMFSIFDQRQHQNLILFGSFFGIFVLTTVIVCRKRKRHRGY